MISLYVDKKSDRATQALHDLLERFQLPADVNLTINNLPEAESGVLRQSGRVVDISLAHCYTMEDVIRELIVVLSRA